MNTEGLTKKQNASGTVYYTDSECEMVAKVCGACKEIKLLDDFPKNKRNLGGRSSKCRTCVATYHEENKEHRNILIRKWREENREKEAERLRLHYEKNKDHMAETNRVWRRNNPEKINLIMQRRRARRLALVGDFNMEQKHLTFEYFGGCALTGVTGDIHWDHVIPIAVGHGGTTYGNMIPLRGDLNKSKGDKNIFEWFEANRQRFNLDQERFDRLIEWLGKANDMTTEEYRQCVYWCHDNPETASA
jgi:hypothetical protein